MLLKSVSSEQVKTLTFDNGKEFTQHEKLSCAVGAACYFAKPYHSWERGLNEHTNGLLRQFFPKRTNFWTVKPEALQRVGSTERPAEEVTWLSDAAGSTVRSVRPCCTSKLKGRVANRYVRQYRRRDETQRTKISTHPALASVY
ncbi:IS30 family transposase [Gloeobacter morelensis]|uniref:IS30 family transposase n=1 Tax=Gloeobacter morelensis TaxID=2907343 RepID=UPI003AB96503